MTAVICFFLQSTLLQKIAIGSISPNLLVIFVVSVGLMRGSKTAMFVGFFTGLLDDLCSGGIVGFDAFLYMAIGYLCGFSCKIYYDNNSKVPVILVAIYDLIYNIGIFVFTFLLRGRIHFLFFLKENQRIFLPILEELPLFCIYIQTKYGSLFRQTDRFSVLYWDPFPSDRHR